MCLCEGPHTNLVFCPKLPLYIPSGNKSVTLPEGLCTICLFTGFEQGINCRHNNVSLWRRSYCSNGRMHYMLCPSCPRHEVTQSWWRQYYNGQLGFVNYKQIVSDLTFDIVRSSLYMVQVHEIAAGVSHTWEGKVNKSSQSAAQIFVNDASPPV